MSSQENYNDSKTRKKSLCDKEVSDDIKGKLLGIGEDKLFHLEEKVGNSKPKDKIDGIIESRKAPGLHSRQISACSIEPRKENDDASRNNMVVSHKLRLVISRIRLGNPSMTPRVGKSTHPRPRTSLMILSP